MATKNREVEYKEIIRANLNNVLASGFIPELGDYRKGKVRDVHFSDDKVIMVASDRVSAFDQNLSRLIPYKGAVLNAFNAWAMQNSSDIIDNAMLESPDPNIIVQKKGKNLGIECVVRGFIWGSLAGDIEKGNRTKCGHIFHGNQWRYQPLPEPIFTPTTKAEKGHDEDITMDEVIEKLGSKEAANGVRDVAIKLYKRGNELAKKAGMTLIDTKYEFALIGNLVFLIDESNTPDSSRYCSAQEHAEKWPQIDAAMRAGDYKNVSELLKKRPELKIREESKQFVRDVLIEAGYQDGKAAPALTDDQVVETAWRYINSYETMTGKKFDFAQSELPTKKRIMNNLIKAGLAYGGCVVPILASKKADEAHWGKLEKALKDNGIPYTEPIFKSAHKQTREVLDYVEQIDKSIEPIVYITAAGRSNGLGPVVAGNTKNPVITCPPFSDTAAYMADIHSSLRMPSELPLATIVDPGNAVLYAKRIIDLAK